jgi:hypothetical protein
MAYVPGSFKAGADPGTLANIPDTNLVISSAGADTTIAYDASSLGLVANTPVYIQYQTVLADAQLKPEKNGTASQATNAGNSVKLYDADTDTYKNVSAEDNVNVPAAQKKWLSKEAMGLSADGRHINWKVTIKTLDRRLDDLVLYERLCGNHTLDPGSIAVSSTPGITHSLVNTSGTAPKGGDYTFKITFGKPAGGSYPDEITVTYMTDVQEGHFDDQIEDLICNNWAWLDFDWYEYGDGATAIPFTFPELNIGQGVHTACLTRQPWVTTAQAILSHGTWW